MKTPIIQSKRCPLCKQTAQSGMRNINDYWYCRTCELGWIKKIPVTLYKDTYYTSGSSLLATFYKPVEIFFFLLRELHTDFTQKKLFIDVGAGDGNYLEHVHAKRKIGVEISQSGRKVMKNKDLKTMTNQEFLKTKNLNATVISFWQVAEHVTKPWEYMKAAEKNLSKSGKIIIAVPNITSFEFNLFGRYWFHLAPDYHIWHFSPKALSKMLEQSNLRIERTDFWAIEHHLTGILQTAINWSSHSEDILHKLIKRRQNLKSLTALQIFWILFWCTIGLPLVLVFWIIASVFKRSGNFTLIATKK